jgi:hypothetical protein
MYSCTLRLNEERLWAFPSGLFLADASTDRLGRSIGPIEYAGVDTLRHPVAMAVSTFHGNRMGVPRGLRPSRLLNVAQGGRDFPL